MLFFVSSDFLLVTLPWIQFLPIFFLALIMEIMNAPLIWGNSGSLDHLGFVLLEKYW